MRYLDQLYNSETLRYKAEELLIQLSEEERLQWLQHSCTQSLIYTLYGDYRDVHEAWEAGEFTSDGAEGTAQFNAKALGQLDAIKLIVQYIEEIHKDDNSDGI